MGKRFFSRGMVGALCVAPFASASCNKEAFTASLPSNAVIEKIAEVATGSEYGEGEADLGFPDIPTNLPEICAVTVNVTSSETSSYRFGLFLPADWNSRFLAVGNGGFGGGINWLTMGDGVRYGFASMSTDTGHNSATFDSGWALNDPETVVDFGWRAMHGSATLAMEMVEEFYGSQLSYSYYAGCSTGGRQGLKEAQLYPDTFDGVLIGAPAWWTSHLQPSTTKLGSYNLPTTAEHHIDSSLFPLIAAEAIRQCDGVDGVEDGIISSPELCDFDASALLCNNTSNVSQCLTEAQLGTLQNIHSDYIAEGEFACPGMRVGTEWQWEALFGGTTPNPLGDGYMQNFLFNDPSWNWTMYNDSIIRIAEEADPGDTTADGYDMSAYRDVGGKVLMYHGMADGLIPMGTSTYFYDRVREVVSPMDGFFRFYLVPGMGHCSLTGTDAPYYFAGAYQAGSIGTDVYSTPGFEDENHDAIMALMAWVEEGKEPDLIATTWTDQADPDSGVLRQRPLCPYPNEAVYDGVGDVNSADSWSCSQDLDLGASSCSHSDS